jgi:rhodanese-related sulfurtransferase/rubrerythrin
MDSAKSYIDGHQIGEYTLIDVRQPEEYEASHIPGATLIPLPELTRRIDELDRRKTTLVYCRSGARAGNATALLYQAGFEEAYNIGGLSQWQGVAATGAPEAGMAIFDCARQPQEYVAVAWEMEEGARLFYRAVEERFAELAQIFDEMAVGEERHRDQLANLYRELGESDADPSAGEATGLMEGGIDREKAITWASGRQAVDVLEFAAAMEANAHDRYIQVGRAVGGSTETAFIQLAEAEKYHLNQLLLAFEQQLR